MRVVVGLGVGAAWGGVLAVLTGVEGVSPGLGAAFGVVAALTLQARGWLNPRLGRRTALAATGLVWSVILVLALLAGGATDAAELAAGALVGLSMPLLFSLVAIPVRGALPTARALLRLLRRRVAIAHDRPDTARLYLRPWRSDLLWWLSVTGMLVGLGVAVLAHRSGLGAGLAVVSPLIAVIRLVQYQRRSR